eukprot:11172535-Lingulodinium_polyedra.AAC.1
MLADPRPRTAPRAANITSLAHLLHARNSVGHCARRTRTRLAKLGSGLEVRTSASGSGSPRTSHARKPRAG